MKLLLWLDITLQEAFKMMSVFVFDDFFMLSNWSRFLAEYDLIQSFLNLALDVGCLDSLEQIQIPRQAKSRKTSLSAMMSCGNFSSAVKKLTFLLGFVQISFCHEETASHNEKVRNVSMHTLCTPFGVSRVVCGRPYPLILRRGPRGYSLRKCCTGSRAVAAPSVKLSLSLIH